MPHLKRPADAVPVCSIKDRVMEPSKSGRPPIDWRRLIPLALAVGVGPAVGRDVTAALREPWGYWPATVTGVLTAGLVALAVYGVAWLIGRPRGPRNGT